mgnify:CR=1 FL=1
MTIQTLKKLRYLPQQIETHSKRLEELKSSGEASPSCVELIKTYESRIQNCKSQLYEGERFIADIEDSFLQQAFFLRYIKGEKWATIALLIGGSNTEDGVRIACIRYIEAKHKD